jgi:hypothetical protein
LALPTEWRVSFFHIAILGIAPRFL